MAVAQGIWKQHTLTAFFLNSPPPPAPPQLLFILFAILNGKHRKGGVFKKKCFEVHIIMLDPLDSVGMKA